MSFWKGFGVDLEGNIVVLGQSLLSKGALPLFSSVPHPFLIIIAIEGRKTIELKGCTWKSALFKESKRIKCLDEKP